MRVSFEGRWWFVCYRSFCDLSIRSVVTDLAAALDANACEVRRLLRRKDELQRRQRMEEQNHQRLQVSRLVLSAFFQKPRSSTSPVRQLWQKCVIATGIFCYVVVCLFFFLSALYTNHSTTHFLRMIGARARCEHATFCPAALLCGGARSV